MGKSIRVTALASVIGVVLAGGVVSSPVATAQSSSTAAAVQSYIITFNEPGLLYYTGGANSLEATAPSAKGERKLDTRSPAAVAYNKFLELTRKFCQKSPSPLWSLETGGVARLSRFDEKF